MLSSFFVKLKGSLNLKLALSLMFVLSVTFSVTGYVGYQYNLRISEHEIGDQFSQNVNQLQARLSLRLQEIYRISTYINFEPNVLRSLQAEGDEISYQDHLQLQRLLKQVMVETPNILGVYLYDMKGNVYRPEVSFLNADLDQKIYNEVIKHSEASDGEIVWFRQPYFEYYENDKHNEIVIATRKLKNSKLETYGRLVLILHERVFENELKNSIRGDSAFVYLFDNKDQLIYSDDPDESIHKMPLSNKSIMKNNKYLIAQSYSDQTKFKLVSRISTQTLHEKSKVILKIAFINGLISILFAGALLFFANKKFLGPLKQLVNGMKRVREGRLDTKVIIHSHDELSFIGNSFNSMVDELNRLIKEVYEKQLLQREAELSALQAQLNPHFLYNTLDMIHGRLYLHGDMDTADIIVGLSKMLRYSLEPSGSLTILSRELDHLKKYLMIQKMRFEEDLNIEIEVGDEHRNCEITRLLLQPIVENVFIHAFGQKPSVKKLEIKARRDNNFLVIDIEDNGCGMNSEWVERINQGLALSTNRIGLSNVMKRIEILYGHPYRLRVRSEWNRGTIVTLYLPYTLASDQQDED